MKHLILFAILIMSCGPQPDTDTFGFPIIEDVQEISTRTVLPEITTKIANPSLNGSIYSVDVLMSSNINNTVLFGGNIRLFIPFNHLTFLEFYDFAPGYGKFAPNPPKINTGNAQSGPAMFNVPGPITYINGAIQIVDMDTAIMNPTYLNDSTFTKIFSIKFTAKSDALCVPIILEKNSNPAYGGFFRGSDGLTYSAVNGPGTIAVTEYADHLNWDQFEGAISIPFGQINSSLCPNF